MNPATYIKNDLADILYDDKVKTGVKITVYEFDNDEQLATIDLIQVIATDYHLDVNEMLLRYFPDIETRKKETYTYIRAEKSHGDMWVVLLSEDNEERHINLSEMYDIMYYSVNSV